MHLEEKRILQNKDLLREGQETPDIRWWKPANALAAAPELSTLTESLYEFQQPGQERRVLSFLPNGLVGDEKGHPLGEVYWEMKVEDGAALLNLCLDDLLVCSLKATLANIWKGSWFIGGATDVVLFPTGATKVHGDKMSGRPDDMVIHVRLSNQLGNCLRNIASVKILADYIGSGWDIDLNQGAAPPEVNSVIQALFPERIKRYPANSYTLWGERRLMQFIDIYGTNSHPIVEAIVEEVPPFSFGTRHIYAFRPAGMTDAEYIKRKQLFYNEIAWPVGLLEQVERFIDHKAKGSLATFAGCHIRYTDNFSDERKQQLNFNTALPVFIERLACLEKQPVLLCTDNPIVRIEVARALPGRNILLPDTISIDAGLWQPMYEMMLLSHTQYLIGSLSSTFSYEACFLRGIDIELFRDNVWSTYQISTSEHLAY
jgi:hypothetical protein